MARCSGISRWARARCPASGTGLRRHERWALAAYVRSLKGSTDTADADNPAAWTVTRDAPYPTYGVTGYQDGRSVYPFKVLRPPTSDPDSRETVHNQGFGQPPPAQSR